MPPLLPGYAYADTPHELTVQPSGYRYGCHGRANRGPVAGEVTAKTA